MPSFQRIRTWSRWMRGVASLTIVILPLTIFWGIYTAMADPSVAAQRFPDLPVMTDFAAADVLLAGLIGATTLIPALFVLLNMRNLFGRYAAGEVLTAACADHIRQIGTGFVVISILNLLIPTAQALVLTLGNPAGSRALMVQISPDSMGFLLAGGLLVAIGWAMTEAARAAEENAGFV